MIVKNSSMRSWHRKRCLNKNSAKQNLQCSTNITSVEAARMLRQFFQYFICDDLYLDQQSLHDDKQYNECNYFFY